jgi:hypothetical protein
MTYSINAQNITLDDLMKRIKETDLVPSRSMLPEDIDRKFTGLMQNGIDTLEDLRKAVKTPKSIASLADKANISVEYLTLLRREIESYFPKAFPFSDFSWLDQNKIKRLESNGYKNTAQFYEWMEDKDKWGKEIQALGLDRDFIAQMFALADLTRIQWVNPTFAGMLYDAGFTGAESVAEADAEQLCKAVERINEEKKYFKGKIGLRDIKRLVKAASYLT